MNIPQFGTIHAIVIGDVMLDEYIEGKAVRLSPEAPVPIVHVDGRTYRPGGAANVAANVAALGADASLLGTIGGDIPGGFLQDVTAKAGVLFRANIVSEGVTTVKTRVVSKGHQLVRYDVEKSGAGAEIPRHVLECFIGLEADVVILSDYGKGVLENPQPIIELAVANGVKVFVDPKGTDWSKYSGATCLTPNQLEFDLACPGPEPLHRRAWKAIDKFGVGGILVTQGENGMTFFRPRRDKEICSYSIPAHPHEVFDVTGAGDTVIAAFALCDAAGCSWDQSVWIANLAASIVVGHRGSATVTREDLLNAIDTASQLVDDLLWPRVSVPLQRPVVADSGD